jgi:hypothetical protein
MKQSVPFSLEQDPALYIDAAAVGAVPPNSRLVDKHTDWGVCPRKPTFPMGKTPGPLAEIFKGGVF